MVFIFLAYFPLYNGLQFHPSHWNWFKWILFNGWVIFHGVYVPQLPYPFVCWWASRLWSAFLEEQVWVAWPLSPGSERSGSLSLIHIPQSKSDPRGGAQPPALTGGRAVTWASAGLRKCWETGPLHGGGLLEGPGTTVISAKGTTRISPTCLGGLESLRGSLMSVRGAMLMRWAGLWPQDS